MTPDSALVAEKDGIQVRIEFRPESTWWAFQPTPEDISRIINISIYRVFMTLGSEIPDTLAECIRLAERDHPAAAAYKTLGINLQLLAVNTLNRFVGYLRSIKGQYWVDEFTPDLTNTSQFFARYNATASIDGAKVKYFDPDIRTFHVVAVLQDEHKRAVTADDWPDAMNFIQSDKRFPLIGTLMANARDHALKGNRRNALVDAVTALEVALSRFAENADFALLGRSQSRVEPKSISPLIEKVGLRGSFGVVLPILLEEVELPNTKLKVCRQAIEKRNSLVHHGTRDVDPKELKNMIDAIEYTCNALTSRTYTEGA